MSLSYNKLNYLALLFLIFSLFIARPVNVRRQVENNGVMYNQSSPIAFDEISSYWSAPKSL